MKRAPGTDPVSQAFAHLQNRPRHAHKGDFGHLLVVAGSRPMPGAAGLAAMAGLRAGAGLVTLAAGESVRRVVAARLAEIMYLPLPEKDGRLTAGACTPLAAFLPRADATLAGPGLGWRPATGALVRELLAGVEKPLVLDADALNCLAGQPEALSACRAPVVVTPHPGEMARLTGLSTADIGRDRAGTAAGFSRRYRVTTVLKGHRTVVASPGGETCLNLTGNPGMATAGSGDVLAGFLAGLLARGLEPFAAACLAVYLHGLAGDFAARAKSEISLVAGDILDFLPAAVEFLRRAG